jgi:hypothetical protein
MRTAFSLAVVFVIAVMIAAWLAVESRAQAPERAQLAGAWSRNHELSDPPPARTEPSERGRGGRQGGGRGGRMGHGGFGGGNGRGAGRSDADRDEATRMREAIHDILQPPDHLTITQTDAMVALTGADGRTTRLAPDGTKIKDDNTKIERKTRWENGRLISEISGAGATKITQTFSADRESHQLRIVVVSEGGRGGQPRTVTHVYDADAQ